ncbi:MAG: hypothetical protein AAGA32_08435 [Pseudomonadota bacterium]
MRKRVVFKVFGERNTGTRTVLSMLGRMPHVTLRVPGAPPVEIDPALDALVRKSLSGAWRRTYLHALRDDLAVARAAIDPWKHAAPVLTPALRAAGARTILLVRNPYSWFLSLARRPYHIKGPKAEGLEAFLVRPWMTERREGMPAVLPSPMDLWTEKLRAAEVYREEAVRAGLGVAVVAFEDLVEDNAAALGAALDQLGVGREGLRALSRNAKQGDPAPCVLAQAYREERWRADLERGVVAGLNRRVDWALAARFGYTRLDPEAFPEQISPERRARILAEMSRLGGPVDRLRLDVDVA